MLDINILKNSGFFKELILKKGEILFDEGEKDNNIYIVLTGKLQVEKSISKESNETKILAYLKDNDVFGESALNTNKEKQVRIKAKNETHLIYIDAKKGLDNFSKKYPADGMNLLKYIIYLSHERLSESNRLITATYKISKEITKITKITNKEIFNLIDILKEISEVDYILYIEKNQVLKNYLTIRYDTREKGKILDKVVEVTDSKLDLLNLKIGNYFSFTQNISIGDEDLGMLHFIKKNDNFTENDKKAILLTTTSIAGVIKQKMIYDEERDKRYMRG